MYLRALSQTPTRNISTMRVKRSPGLRRSITSSNGWLRKVYRYEAKQDAAKSSVQVRIQLATMTFHDFLRQHG